MDGNSLLTLFRYIVFYNCQNVVFCLFVYFSSHLPLLYIFVFGKLLFFQGLTGESLLFIMCLSVRFLCFTMLSGDFVFMGLCSLTIVFVKSKVILRRTSELLFPEIM